MGRDVSAMAVWIAWRIRVAGSGWVDGSRGDGEALFLMSDMPIMIGDFGRGGGGIVFGWVMRARGEILRFRRRLGREGEEVVSCRYDMTV